MLLNQKAKLVFSVSTCLLASNIIHPRSNLALARRLTPAQLQLVSFKFFAHISAPVSEKNTKNYLQAMKRILNDMGPLALVRWPL